MCQFTNLLFWLTLHTPLTVVERWRHSYDVFPDAGRAQPFGSGATCAWPVLDLQVANRTGVAFRLAVRVGDTDLEGAWTAGAPVVVRYEVYEVDHRITEDAPGSGPGATCCGDGRWTVPGWWSATRRSRATRPG